MSKKKKETDNILRIWIYMMRNWKQYKQPMDYIAFPDKRTWIVHNKLIKSA